ncbi:MAG: chromosome segregation protein SMC [Endozoicomonadaceae bacterium]|nr:chromosome segregation protein SMC [Endozoicomonadaceae bacterium]
MRLKCIKLIGFKSFVEATTVSFPSNLCAVVGPNGCGKSNIIDAVRWVMGESSAKNLRGESMMDVIFKGSKKRKPAGFAQIELLFDNQAGRITGEYAAYAEISVKRRLRSDGQNYYFLNGSKCRRRDIMDIFLGTGLGPRSYSIISQGMISHLVESKPEELRFFLEEAAGISKYKERRRETENRMKRTLENLDRLTDLRDELTKRLSHLKHQAENAEKYKTYQEQSRIKQAQSQGIRWKSFHETLQKIQLKRSTFETKMESHITKQVHYDTQLDKSRIIQQEQQEQFQKKQADYYQINNHITRIEQTLAHQTERCQQLSNDLKNNQLLQSENEKQLDTDQSALIKIAHHLEQLSPEKNQSSAYQEELESNVQIAEERMADWHHRWDICIEKSNEKQREAEVLQSNIQHTEHIITRLQEQIAHHQVELKTLDIHTLHSTSDQLKNDLSAQQNVLESLNKNINTINQLIQTQQNNVITITQKQQTCHENYCKTQGQYSSLIALQEAAEQSEENPAEWLAEKALDHTHTVSSLLKVETGWELAVETILGEFLQARLIDRIESLSPIIDHLDQKQVNFIIEAQTKTLNIIQNRKPLTDYVSGVNLTILNQVYCADSLKEAWAIRKSLNADTSVITQSGIWMGQDWIRIPKIKNPELTLLHRQKTLAELTQQLNKIALERETCDQLLSVEQKKCDQIAHQANELILQRNTESQKLGELTAAHQAQKQRINNESNRRDTTEEQCKKAQSQQSIEKEKLMEYRAILELLLDTMQTHLSEQDILRDEKETLQIQITDHRLALTTHQDNAHDLSLQYKQLETQHDALKQAIDRATAQKIRIEKIVEELNVSLKSVQTIQTDNLSNELTEQLEQQSLAENQMNTARMTLDDITESLAVFEKQKHELESTLQQYRTQIDTLRLEEQEIKVRSETIEEQLTVDQFNIEHILRDLPKEATENQWTQEIEKLASKIQQLGLINLAAIDEYDQQSERLHYLNHQNDDLQDALNTLEKAIERIDQETKQRFEQTFNAVNEGLNTLFPRIFGGGTAYLIQTDDDILRTGITIMAQPPGKKNTTIHLLSGGEKALTAIALVFSIFKLNPSPFCMLDEVDAPLDDANVGRYIKMVKEMSEHIQFIYVTHNKIAMEEAHQLIGVTMHEPGVSRPVSVDIDVAAEMIST